MTLESLIQAKSADFMEHHGYLFDGPDQVYEGVMAFLTSSLKEAYLAGIEASEGATEGLYERGNAEYDPSDHNGTLNLVLSSLSKLKEEANKISV